jgi:hypothetical protein
LYIIQIPIFRNKFLSGCRGAIMEMVSLLGVELIWIGFLKTLSALPINEIYLLKLGN